MTIDGTYGRQTQVAVEAFQQSHTLPVTGVIGPTTWTALLAYPTPGISWTLKKKQLSATVTPAIARRARRSASPLVLPVPESASLPERRNELHGAGSSGGDAPAG